MKNSLETRLGIFFALALVVAVIILEMVGAAEYLRPGYQVSGNFKNAQELKRGDPVKIAGVEIGRVEDIKLIDNQAQVILKVNGKYDIKTDATAIIKFTGLMGQNFVSIEGGTSAAPNIDHSKGGTLKTYEQPDLSAIMVKLDNVATGVEGLTKSFSTENFSTLLGPVLDIFTQNRSNINAIVSNTRDITDDIAQGKGTVGLLIKDPSLYNRANAAMADIQSASGDLKGLLASATTVMNQARGVMDDVGSGRGTIGKLIKEETLYIQTTNLMDNLIQITDKANKGTGSVARILNDESLYKNAKLSLQKLDKATEGLEDQGPLSVLGVMVNSLF
jgi:phospholipid/cholesterol/gamma-HCH transport system substrate-binding protein